MSVTLDFFFLSFFFFVYTSSFPCEIEIFMISQTKLLLLQGAKFIGDLLPGGKIRAQETQKIFSSPSSWAIHCKKLLNPDKKSGCGWSSVSSIFMFFSFFWLFQKYFTLQYINFQVFYVKVNNN